MYRDWSLNRYFNCTPSNPSPERCGVPYSCCRPSNDQQGDSGIINTQCGFNTQELVNLVSIVHLESIYTFLQSIYNSLHSVDKFFAVNIQLFAINTQLSGRRFDTCLCVFLQSVFFFIIKAGYCGFFLTKILQAGRFM